jgi:hypothetical protein
MCVLKYGLLLWLVCFSSLSAAEPVLKRSDVVFMYQSDRQTYKEYAATVLAWGGKPTSKSSAEAEAAGVKFFGSVGMVTEFARYYERFPETYEQGLCRDVDGQPVKVPWLTDHQHEGVPYWWCCTQQPQFRRYLRERVIETVEAGADGVHVDDHLGTAGGLWLGICFCDRCVPGFREHLKSLPADERQRLGVEPPDEFNYRAVLQQWQANSENKRRVQQHPLWGQWSLYQCRAAATFMMELRKLAATTAGRPVPIGANAGLLWPRHLTDYAALDLFSAETDHHASGRQFTDQPLVAYRLAEAVQRPYAATASGHDWAFIKEHQLPGLVRSWVALSYAAGQRFMAPHRQWCYTPEKGTHWYAGPAEKFAPLYRFVRSNSLWFDDYEAYADVAVVLPHRSFLKDPRAWFDLCNQLAEANLSYRLLLAGDELVIHPLKAEMLKDCPVLLIRDRDDLLPDDRKLLDEYTADRRVYTNAAEVVANVRPVAQLRSESGVRVLPRVAKESAVVHLLNTAYDAEVDDVRSQKDVEVRLDLQILGIPGAGTCQFLAPDAEPHTLPVYQGTVTVPQLGLWGLLVFSD